MNYIAYNEHDELKRAMGQIEALEPLAQAAVEYVMAIMQAHHIPVSKGYIANKLNELSHKVGEYQEW